MKTKNILAGGIAAVVLALAPAYAQQPVSPPNAALPEMGKTATRTGKRVNRVIDLWLKGQPVYYSQTSGGGYEGPGRSPDRADAMVWAMTELSETRSGVPRVRML